MNSKFDENLCPVCYESLDDENCIEIIGCKHRFCRCCSNDILLQKDICCPLDRNPIDRIIDSKFSQNSRDISITIPEFQILMFNHEQDIFINEFESCWSATLLKFNSGLNQIIKMVHDLLEIEQNYLERDFMIKKCEKNIIENIVTEINEIADSFHKDREVVSEKCMQFFEYLSNIPISQHSLIQRNILESVIIYYGAPFPKHAYQRIILKEILNEGNSSEEKIKIIREELQELTDLSSYYKSLIIIMLRNNNELYKSVQSNINENDIDLCLICTGIINKNNYSKFPNCNHKICFNCTNKFLITHASCPFDNCESFSCLEIIDCNNQIDKIDSLKYFKDKYETIFQQFYENIFNFNDKKIEELVDVNCDLVVLMKLVNYLQKTIQSRDASEEQLNWLLNKIKKEFQKLSKNTSIRSYITKASLYSCKLDSLVMFTNKIHHENSEIENFHHNKINIIELDLSTRNYDAFVWSLFAIEERINDIYSYEDIIEISNDFDYLIYNYDSISTSRSITDQETKFISSDLYVSLRELTKAKLLIILMQQ